MKKYYIDTNVILRFLLKDNQKLSLKAENYFVKAKKEIISLVLLPEIIIECEYVLRKVYNAPREDIVKVLSSIIKMPYLALYNRNIMVEALNLYNKRSIDLVDIILYVSALRDNARVLSFDKDFEKF